MFDAFGRLIADPERLPRDARILALRATAGELQASASPGARWLGRTLSLWLAEGGDLAAVLGVRPARGSRSTPQAMVRRDLQDAALARLVAGCGTAAAASRALLGGPCGSHIAALRDEAIALGCCRTPAGIGRAIARHRA